MNRLLITLLLGVSYPVYAKDTFTPISHPGKLPKSALELWKNYDPKVEPLEVKIIKEWKTDEAIIEISSVLIWVVGLLGKPIC